MNRIARIFVLAAALSAFAPLASAEMSVNINDDSIKLMAKHLDGIGVRRAAAIAKYRQENGAFESVDDLAKVKGVSRSLVEKNRDRISLGEMAEPKD